MNRFALLAILAASVATAATFSDDTKNVTRVTIPDDKEAALQVLQEWLAARGIEVEARKGVLLMRRGGVLQNLIPLVYKGELDRIRVIAFYSAKPEFKGTKELEQLAVKLNRTQNLLQVFVDDEGDLAAGSNLTFYDELTAREFDAFADLFAQIVKGHVLSEEARKMLK